MNSFYNLTTDHTLIPTITNTKSQPFNKIVRLMLGVVLSFVSISFSFGQATINCPSNITVNATSGQCGATVNFAAPTATCSGGSGTTVTNFNYTGGVQNFTVPAGVTSINIQAWGAQGRTSANGSAVGGQGGLSSGNRAVTPGEVIRIYVGGGGGVSVTGGYNGGGNAGATTCAIARGGGGGGASDVRAGGTGLNNRVIVAGGGGGGGGHRRAGCGRGTGGGGGGGWYGGGGGAGWPGIPPGGAVPTGGTQGAGGTRGFTTWTAGGPTNGFNGAFGTGGAGGNEEGSDQAGSANATVGGFGGATVGQNGSWNSTNDWTGQSGAGGSGYIGGVTAGSTTGNQRTGNGLVRITYTLVNSPTITQTAGQASGTFFPIGTTTNTFLATCPTGSPASCSFTVTVVDNQNPTISCPSNITVNTASNSCAANVNYSVPTATDNCPGVGVSRTAGPASGGSFALGTTTVTHLATDASGNTASCNFTVTVNDNQNPSISCPANINVNAASGSCAANVNYSTPSASDNCSVITALTGGLASGSSFPVGTTTVSYSATDPSSNSVNCSFSVTVNDAQNPAISCPANISVGTTGSCGATVTYSTPTATDNCPGVGVALTAGSASGSSFPSGTNTVTYTATDATGNTASCSFTITVSDDDAPTISGCPSSISVGNTSGQCSATVNWSAPTATDNCPGVTVALTSGQSPGSTFSLGTVAIQYTATDAAGNTALCNFNVTVSDTENPTISCPSNISVPNASGQCGATVSFASATFADNCPGATLAQTAGSVSGSFLSVGTQTITYVATDGSSNTATCSFTVTVTDDEDPVFLNCPANLTANTDAGVCTAMVNYATLLANDNCDGTVAPVQSAGQASGTAFGIGVTTNTFTATDAAGNVGTCSFTVTVSDDEAPQMNCPSDQIVTFDGSCQYEILDYSGQVGFLQDNCDASPTISQTPAAATTITGSTQITLTATDASGNSIGCTFDVIPNDIVDPTITCPADDNVSVNSICQFTLPNYTGAATNDDCDSNPVVTQSPAVGSILTLSTVVTLTVTDGSGNTGTCTFNAIPTDDTNPTITCPANQLESFDAGCEFDLADYTGLATVADNCDASPTVTQSPVIGFTISGTTVVTLTVTDASLNTATCSFSVIPDDNEDPVVNCPSDQTVNFNTLCQFNIINFTGLASAADNCDTDVTLSQSPVPGTSIGTTTAVQITATDDAGNTSICSFDVIPSDVTNPSASCPTNQIVNFDANCDAVLANYVGSLTANDNCDSSPSVVQSPVAGGTITSTTTVTMTVTDASSNSTTCSFDVIPQDVTNPTIVCGADLNVSFSASCQYTVGNYLSTPTANDNCDASPTITQSPTLGTVITGSTVVTLTATDASGNSATCTFNINPTDGQNPSISCPTNENVNFSSGCDFSLADYTGSATASDNCDLTPTVTQSPGIGSVQTGATTVTLTATDDAGNTNTCTFSVTPADATNPVITCPANQSEDFTAGCDFDLPDYGSLATTSDNCDASVAVTQSPVATTTITGSQTITLTATDDAGNTTTCTFNVLPDDNTDPIIVCPADQPANFNAQCLFNLLDYTGLGSASDNCDASPVVTQSPVSGTSIGTTTAIILTATDANGNTGTCTFNVVPVDATNPVVNCPGNQQVSFNASCEYDLLNYAGTAISSDNCDASPTVTQSPVATTTVTGTTTVTLTATDAAGNVGTCTFDIIPEDETDPNITCPSDATVSFDAACQYVLTSYSGSATVTDDCDALLAVTQSPASGTTISGTTEITLTATDASGNLSTCTFDVIPEDDTNPTIACPLDQTVSSNSSCQFTIVDYTAVGTVSDNCDLSVAVTQSPAFGTIITVPTTVTLTAEDDNVNTASCTFLVTPADNDNPNISCPGNQIEDFDADCEFDVIDYTTMATATDNCSATPTVTQSPASGTTISGQTTITLTATDTDSNTATCTFEVIPADNTAPVVSCPIDQDVSFNNLCQFTLTDYTGISSATDNCDNGPTISQSPIVGSLIGGITVVTISATDAAGNIGTCTFNVNPADNAAPVVACPLDITEPFDASCSFTLTDYTSFASVSDNCSTAPFTVTQLPASGTAISGTTTITLSVTDAAGNTGDCTFDVLPDDNVDPTISCPTDQTVSTNANCQFALADYTGFATVLDNCDLSPIVSQSPAISSVHSIVTLVTLTATDASGNTASCSFNVIPEDDVDPTVVCPLNQNVNFTSNCEFTLPDYTGLATGDDNCDNTPFITQSPGIGNLVSGTTTVTISIVDDAGNSGSCTFQVIPTDSNNPTVTCPSSVTEALSAACDFSLGDYTSLVSSTDNCDTDVAISQSPAAGNTVSSTTTITITGTDDAGNTATCAFNVILEDQTAPVVTCPADQTVSFGNGCQFTMTDYTSSGSTADNCDPNPTVTQLPLAGSSIGGATIVTLSATDASGNVGTCTFNVIPADNVPPIIFGCPIDITVNNDAGSCDAVVNYASITATDNCDGLIIPTLTSGQASGTIFPLGTTTVIYTATDGNLNSSSCEFDVTVLDAEDPVIICPTNSSTFVDGNTCAAVVTYSLPTVTDNCTSGIIPTLSSGLASGASFPVGTSTVTYLSDDGNGNTSTCSFEVEVLDNVAPVITCPANITTDSDVNSCNAFVNYALPTVTDNCATGIVPTLTAGQTSGSNFPNGTTTISYTANDGNGNSASCSFTITVEDNEPPLILACPLDITTNVQPNTCGAAVSYQAVIATDNCAGTIIPTLTSGLTSGSTFPLGLTTVTYEANDGSGNISTCSFSVTVIDNQDPVITCPADIVLPAAIGTCGADVTYTLPTVTDNCTAGIVPTLEAGLSSGSNFPVGTTVVTYQGDDGNGNTAQCSFNVTIEDDEDPVITCPAAISVSNDPGNCAAIVTYTLPSVTDNCTVGIVPTLVDGLASGSSFTVGTVNVIYQAVDASGNTVTCLFAVTVNDTEDPVLTCPADIAVGTDPSVCQAVVTYAAVTVSDNCTNGIVPVLQAGLGSGDPFLEGTTVVTYGATDAAGNSSSCSFNVVVDDTEDPTVSCPADLTETFNASCMLTMPDYTSLASTQDNCDGAPAISQSPAVGTVVTGTTTVSLISTDFTGNSSSCTFVITDNTPPTVVCPNTQQVGFNINCAFVLTDFTPDANAADNCGGTSLTQDPAIGTVIFNQTTVTINVEDDFGNAASCDFEVIPSDNIPPSITCVGSQSVFFDTGCQFTLPDYTTQASALDNCDTDPEITQVPSASSVITGITSVTLTATDDDGNAVACSFNVTPTDNQSPSILCPSDQAVSLDVNCEFVLLDYSSQANAGDNCTSVVGISQDPAIGSAITANTVVTLTATDDAGNTNDCVFLVSPSDNTDPVVTCPGDIDVSLNANCEYNVSDYSTLLTITDNCSSTFIYTQTPSTGTPISAATTVSITAMDANGNSASCTFSITPSDLTAPEIECPDNLIVALDVNCEFGLDDYTASAITSDNCATSVTVQQSPVSGTFITTSTVVTLIADDGNGNSADCTFEITPLDSEAPTIICPVDQDVSFNANCEFELPDYTTLATVDDNCSSVIDIVQAFPSSTGGGQGGWPGSIITQTETLVLTAADESGNSITCEFDVIPTDNTAPVVVCPGDQAGSFNANCEFELIDYGSLVNATDNCGLLSVTQDQAAGTIITGATEVTFTAEDNNGNTSSCSFFVNPADGVVPEISCPANQSVDVDANCQFAVPDYSSQAVVTDNCGTNITVSQFPPVATVVLGNTVVTLTADDGNGNTANCSFAITPEDNTDPEILVCAPDQEVILNANCVSTVPDFRQLISASDNCDIDLQVSQVPGQGTSLLGTGTQVVTITVQDDNGNTSTCEFDLTSIDDTDPLLECPADQVLVLSANCEFEVPDYTNLAIASDACAGVTLTQSPPSGSIITAQLNATIIAEDDHGNTATCTFFVTPEEMVVSTVSSPVSCQGGTDGSAMVTVIGGNAPYSEDWGGFNPGSLAWGTYSVTVSDVNGCSATDIVVIEDGDLFELEVNPSGLVEVCEGESVLLDAGAGYAVYTWSTGASVQSITVSQEATYWVHVTNTVGCQSNTDTITLQFLNPAQPSIIEETNGIIACSNDSAVSYQWSLNGVNIAGATDFNYCPIESGNYQVEIIDAFGCVVESYILEYTFDTNSPCATGIHEYDLSFDVYPNPSTGSFTIDYALTSQRKLEIAVFDMVGKRVTNDIILNGTAGRQTLDLSSEAEGVYSLRIILDENKMYQERLIIVK